MPESHKPLSPKRIVFVGDSITDGHSYPLLIAQGLAAAGKSVPICTNAGVASDTARVMAARVERDVIAYKPDLMTLSVGINDCIRNVDVDEYARDARTVITTAMNAGVTPIMMTTSVLGPKQGDKDTALNQYNARLTAIAADYGLRVAQVNRLQHEARAAGINVLEADDVHPNFEGHRVMARAVLDALGYPEVAVPLLVDPPLMPGIVSPWKLRPVDRAIEAELSETTVQSVVPDDSWKTWSLPETSPGNHWWIDQERRRGFATTFDSVVGKSKHYLGVATLDSPEARSLYFNTGGQLQTIWLNDKLIYRHTTWNGWHPGRERIAAPLVAGKNRIVIETFNQFFLSVTEGNDW